MNNCQRQTETLDFTGILKRFLIVIVLFFSQTSWSQELDTVLQANESLHSLSLRYYGSEFNVDPNYYYRLEDLAEEIIKDSTLHLHVRGHVCCGPSERLSKRRAKKVYKFLLNLGIPKARMSWKGYSDTCPRRWPEKTDEDAALNRRVDFVIRKMDKKD